MPWTDALHLDRRPTELARFEQWSAAARQAEHHSRDGFFVGFRDCKAVVWKLGDAQGNLRKVWETARQDPLAAFELDCGYVQFLTSIARSRYRQQMHLVEAALAPDRTRGLPLTDRRILEMASLLEQGAPIPPDREDGGTGTATIENASTPDRPASSSSQRAGGTPGSPAANAAEHAATALAPCEPAPSHRDRYSWQQFVNWCRKHQQSPWPASGDTVAGFLRDNVSALSIWTLRSRLYAISRTHRSGRLPDPYERLEVKRAWEFVLRCKSTPAGVAVHDKDAADTSELEAIRAVAFNRRRRGGGFESTEAAQHRGLADIAIFSLVRESGLSSRQVAGLTWKSVTAFEDGTPCVSVTVGSTNTKKSIGISLQAQDCLKALRKGAGADAKIFPLGAKQVRVRLAVLKRSAGLSDHHTGVSAGDREARATRPPNSVDYTPATARSHPETSTARRQ